MTGNGPNGAKNGRGSGRNGRNGNGYQRAVDNRNRRRGGTAAAATGPVAPLRPRHDHRARPHRRGVLTAAAFTGAQAFVNSCRWRPLKPVSIGENSFVYAADGSLLGSIPPSRTVSRSRSTRCRRSWQRPPSRSRTGASTRTPASTSRASSARPSRTSRRARSCRAARRSRSSSSATSTSAATSPGSEDEEACLAEARGRGPAEALGADAGWTEPRGAALAQGPHPRDVPEPGVLRRSRVRGRGRRADVLLEARRQSQPPGGSADRRPAAGSLDLRSVPVPTRPSPAATTCWRPCGTRTTSASRRTRRRLPSRSRAGAGSTRGFASPSSSATCASSSSTSTRRPCAAAASRSTRRSTRATSASPSTR